jgi:hypothetical protein
MGIGDAARAATVEHMILFATGSMMMMIVTLLELS